MPTFLSIPWWRPEAISIPLPDVGFLPDVVEIHPFGLMVAMAVLVGARVADWRARDQGLHPRAVGELVGYMLIGGFVLGHMLDAVFYHWEVVVERPVFLLELWNGLSSFGGFVGAGVGAALWVSLRKHSFIAFADVIAFAFPSGWLFGRLGCSIAHDHPGAVTDFPLAVADYQLRGGAPPWLTRHDLGLYEVFWCLAVIPLFFYLGRRRRPQGFYLALLPLVYAPARFLLDFLRATDIPQQDPRFLGLTPGHYGAVLLFMAGLVMAARVRRGPEATIAPEAAWPEVQPPDEAEAVALAIAARDAGGDADPGDSDDDVGASSDSSDSGDVSDVSADPTSA